MGRARSFNDAHNSSRQQGDWAYRAIDEHEGGGCFYSRAEKAFPGTNGKVGEGGPLTTPNSSSCCQEGLELCFHPLSPLFCPWELVLQFGVSLLFPVLLLVGLAYSQAVPEDIHPFSVLGK